MLLVCIFMIFDKIKIVTIRESIIHFHLHFIHMDSLVIEIMHIYWYINIVVMICSSLSLYSFAFNITFITLAFTFISFDLKSFSSFPFIYLLMSL